MYTDNHCGIRINGVSWVYFCIITIFLYHICINVNMFGINVLNQVK